MKRFVCIILTLILMLSLLSGCGTKSQVNGSDGKNSTGSSQAVETTTVEKEKPVLKVLRFYTGGIDDPNKNIMAAEVEKVTGYKVEYFMLPLDNEDEKLMIEVAAGIDYDVMNIRPSQFQQLLSNGAVLEINDLLNNYGSHIKEAISQKTWGMATSGGKIYGVPQRSERPNVYTSMAVRQDILTGLGLQLPRTIDEFYNVLKVIKDKKPDMIPFTGAGTNPGLNMGGELPGIGANLPVIYSAFGLATNWTDVNGSLVPRLKMPGMKDFLAFMAKLYKEGLVDADWPVNKTTNSNEKFTSGKAAIILYGWLVASNLNPVLRKNVPGAEVGIIQPLEGKNGEVGIQLAVALNSVSVIPKSSKHPEDVVKWMDIKILPENFTYITLGLEGETFKKEDGKYIPIMPAFTEKRNFGYWYTNGYIEDAYAEMWLARIRRNADLADAYEKMNKDIDKYGKESPTAFMPPSAEYSKYITTICGMEEDYFIKLLSGAVTLDGFENFIAEWEKAGGTQVIKEVNDWYKSTKK